MSLDGLHAIGKVPHIREYLKVIHSCKSPTDPRLPDVLTTLVKYLDAKDESLSKTTRDCIASFHVRHPSLYTGVLLSPSIPPEDYPSLAMEAFSDPSGTLVNFLLDNPSDAYASFWTSDNKSLLAKLLTHPNKSIRLLGMRLSASKPIYHPPGKTLVFRIKAPLRRLFKR